MNILEDMKKAYFEARKNQLTIKEFRLSHNYFNWMNVAELKSRYPEFSEETIVFLSSVKFDYFDTLLGVPVQISPNTETWELIVEVTS